MMIFEYCYFDESVDCFFVFSARIFSMEFKYRLMLPTDGDNLTSSLSNCITFISFSLFPGFALRLWAL